MVTEDTNIPGICEEDFEDETSRLIFRALKKRYEENDWSYIVRMVCRLRNLVRLVPKGC